MAFSPGTHLGVYEIVTLLGAGGMGEVYRARDTRLNRTVALKVLPAALADDPQLHERFAREARAISSLNHPHICALYDIAEAPHPDVSAPGSDTVRFLVLEYLDGHTLAERLTRGPLPPAEALRYAIDICDALDAAHRAGLVHRDLKPANVMLVKAGAKLLDFGLAKSIVPLISTDEQSTHTTLADQLTTEGVILGTFQYMAPEQLEGHRVDSRTDIFAFGALLFEMLTGRGAFERDSRAGLLGAILHEQPPLVSSAAPEAPRALDRIVATCLAKAPDDRYQSARDLLRDLTWVCSEPREPLATRTVETPTRSTRLAWLLAGVSLIALTAAAIMSFRPVERVVAPPEAAQFTIAPPENMSFGGAFGSAGAGAGGTRRATQVAVSPDGRNIVFVAGAGPSYRLWLRPIAALTATPIAGTEGGRLPFWSPDSRSIGFFADGKLKIVQIAGGPPIVLTDAPGAGGGSWSRDNVILFAPGPSQIGLLRVSSTGGVPTVATTLDPANGEDVHRWPHFLPDGRHFFYTAVTGPCCPPASPSVIRIASLDGTGPGIPLLQAESPMSYASSHVLFARGETLMAQPFDLGARQLSGEAFPIAERVTTEITRYVGASVSENGILVYGQAGVAPAPRLTWFDRTGRVLGTLGDAAPYHSLALSPDERSVAVALPTGNPENLDIWLIDVVRNLRSRLTVDPGPDAWPVWSPDGTRIVFQSSRSGQPVSLQQRLSNGAGTDELLLAGPGNFMMAPSGWSADGRFIAYITRGSNVQILPLFGDRKSFPLVETPFTETSAVFSPNGRWIAYTSNEGGQPDIYVRPFPGPGGKSRVSRDGGGQPAWRADGKELFYVGLDGTIMAVPIETGEQFQSGEPQALFAATPSRIASLTAQYAVTKDGQRFLVAARPQQSSTEPLIVILNWTTAVQK